jgi:hypothetical protein
MLERWFSQWFNHQISPKETFVLPKQELLLLVEDDKLVTDSLLSQLGSYEIFEKITPLKRVHASVMANMPIENWGQHCLYFTANADLQPLLEQLPPVKGGMPFFIEISPTWDLIKMRKLPWQIISKGYHPVFVVGKDSMENNSLDAFQRWINKGATFAINPTVLSPKLAKKFNNTVKTSQWLLQHQLGGFYVLTESECAEFLSNPNLPIP